MWGLYSPVPDPTAAATRQRRPPRPRPSASASPEASASASPEASASRQPRAQRVGPEPSPSPSPSASVTDVTNAPPLIQATENTPEFQQQIAALDCTDPVNYTGGRPDDPVKWLGTCEVTGQAKYNLEPAFIQGTNVTGANAVLPQGGVGWVVSLDFDAEGARALADASTRLSALPECGIAGANPCNAFAIVLDGVVTSAPRFNEPILGGSAQIEGNFTAQEARDLANILKYGALPVTLEPVDITTVSPTVGNDQLRAGIIAGLLGLLLVAIYLVAYYRALGVVAVLSLIIAGVMLYLTLDRAEQDDRPDAHAGRASPVPSSRSASRRTRSSSTSSASGTRSARAARCGRPATPAGSAPVARCWPRTSCRSSPPSCSTCCPSAACAASRSCSA